MIEFLIEHWKGLSCAAIGLILLVLYLRPKKKKLRGHWFD
jgi:hypothetical protein